MVRVLAVTFGFGLGLLVVSMFLGMAAEAVYGRKQTKFWNGVVETFYYFGILPGGVIVLLSIAGYIVLGLINLVR